MKKKFETKIKMLTLFKVLKFAQNNFQQMSIIVFILIYIYSNIIPTTLLDIGCSKDTPLPYSYYLSIKFKFLKKLT